MISAIEAFATAISSVLFYEIFGIPFLVAWFVCGALFFTFRLGFINIRLIPHALELCFKNTYVEDAPGEITSRQAFASAVSATVGLGNISGVAVAVGMGGPGAVIWMTIAGFFAMSLKFAEVTLAHKYRYLSPQGKVRGGGFYFLTNSLQNKPYVLLGTGLAGMFALFCILGSLGGGNMFQANQAVKMMVHSFGLTSNPDTLTYVLTGLLTLMVGVTLIGGIKRIAKVASILVPIMTVIYLFSAGIVLMVHIAQIPHAFFQMLALAFDWQAAGGGVVGTVAIGLQRASFSNEAGLGSAPIAHSVTKTNEPVREGCVALLEPFIDTMVICLITGLLITVTGVYHDSSLEGVVMTSRAFETVFPWFPVVLSLCVVLFAFSTIITWSYYGESAFCYLFGEKNIRVFHLLYCGATFFGGIATLNLVVKLSDLFMLSMGIPNLISLYILSSELKRDLDSYFDRLRTGQFVTAKVPSQPPGV